MTDLIALPAYLRAYVVEQDPSLYTAIDHAAWRFILKLSKHYFKTHAHSSYLEGLEKTGILSDQIPLISDIDAKLSQFGWRAVAISGFIPPSVFMEFLSLAVLPIACDMRRVEHLSYTPAPDIVHEAAGHAPILADPDYADYLKHYGELSRKAIYSAQDLDVYEAVRILSDLKEDPRSTPAQVSSAQQALDRAVASSTDVSEATWLARMAWWTVEYGLIGPIEQPKIYGAGLLSSMGESFHCLSSRVTRIPFSIDCVETSYDITRPQPQLYVTPDFESLKRELHVLEEKMAFRLGGSVGLDRARESQTVTTVELDSGIQISGKLARWDRDGQGRATYLQFEGPCQLARDEVEISGQGPKQHTQGYGTPVGKARGWETLQRGKRGALHYESGALVEGVPTAIETDLATFTDCTVRRGEEILFRPEWGVFDLARGESVVSVFGGPADRAQYLAQTGGLAQTPGRPKTTLTEANRPLVELYSQMRAIRESGRGNDSTLNNVKELHRAVRDSFPNDWLLRYEILEWVDQRTSAQITASWRQELQTELESLARSSSPLAGDGETIRRGLELL